MLASTKILFILCQKATTQFVLGNIKPPFYLIKKEWREEWRKEWREGEGGKEEWGGEWDGEWDAKDGRK